MEFQRTIRVLVVDDSAFMRKTVSSILNSAEDIEVVATARDGLDAVQKLADTNPDVITLDIEMPRLDGLHTLGYIMSERPTPVVILSAYTEKGGETTMKALEYGAVDFVCKPSGPISLDINKIAEELTAKVRMAAGVDVSRLTFLEFDKIERIQEIPPAQTAGRKVLMIAASTGGPRALYEIIPKLPADLPAAVLVVQHMSIGFTASLADRLDRVSALRVKEAQDGDEILSGHIYLAPGDYHMTVAQEGQKEVVRLNQEPARNGVRPAADATLESAAPLYGKSCLAVILTGMGHDGTKGAQAVKRHGGMVLAQDQASSVVFGMPKSAIESGCVDHIYPLSTISEKIAFHLQAVKSR